MDSDLSFYFIPAAVLIAGPWDDADVLAQHMAEQNAVPFAGIALEEPVE